MDNLTHSLIGATVANAGLKQKLGRGATLALIVASNITDIDIFGFCLHEGPSFLYRRMWTHSILGMPVLSVVFGFVFGKFFPNLGFKKAFGLFLIGTSLHVLFDLMNSYGVVVLHPFTLRRFELAWVFIIDLAIWGMLLLPLLIALLPRFRAHLKKGSQMAIGVLTLYVLFCGTSRWRANSLLATWIKNQNEESSFAYVFPEAFGPHRFRGVARINDTYQVFLIHSLSGRMEKVRQVKTDESSPQVQQILKTEKARGLLWFAKAPVWQRTNDSNEWEVFDLRFESAVIARSKHFAYRFRVNNSEVEYLGR